jgi:hypothetical protein
MTNKKNDLNTHKTGNPYGVSSHRLQVTMDPTILGHRAHFVHKNTNGRFFLVRGLRLLTAQFVYWTCCTWNSQDIPEVNTFFTLNLVPKTAIHEQRANLAQWQAICAVASNCIDTTTRMNSFVIPVIRADTDMCPHKSISFCVLCDASGKKTNPGRNIHLVRSSRQKHA